MVEPGEKVPMDGDVTEGSSTVNQAPITGESVPVEKTQGEEVYAGTVNQQGYLEVEVTAESSEKVPGPTLVQFSEGPESPGNIF